jgi:DNA-binding LytR/AlgR family response regulator
MSLNILIVEDDISFSIELEILVKKIGYNVVGVADNSASALELIFGASPDFILMDIDIKGALTGTDIGEKIKHLNIPVLFITSFGDEKHYQAAQKSNAVGYLVKPVDKYSLRTAIDLAFKQTLSAQQPNSKPTEQEDENSFILKNSFFFKKKGIHHKVLIEDILFIKSDENYCEINTKAGQSFLARITLAKVREMLPEEQFLQIHRQYIIRIDCIESIDFQESVLKIRDKTLPVSRSHRKKLENVIRKMS